jgi:hypothetical protein
MSKKGRPYEQVVAAVFRAFDPRVSRRSLNLWKRGRVSYSPRDRGNIVSD